MEWLRRASSALRVVSPERDRPDRPTSEAGRCELDRVEFGQPRRRGGRGPVLLAALALLALALLTAGCSVDGQATAGGSEDLTARSLAPADFPDHTATRLPAPAVPAALADLSGRPLHGSVTPAECTPRLISPDGAVVIVGPDPATSTATFTSAVVHVDDSLDQVTGLARRCPRTVTGSAPTAVTVVTTEVLPAPNRSGNQTAALRRTMTTGGAESPLITGTTGLMAQQDGIRVIVEYRHQGADEMSAEAGASLDALFDSAITAAFG
ncbi:hypothetical protein [Gordonia tangerina]|uniref:DUF5642 domain-containing protein n=1 Tax=Gordonia tangerina TaxID=2911060 RepID=A0ABS9DG27_9ACTN|nr:hypothetical protein [Gordonia tangerina]MCF3937554.1 hypothetical protein [Gordonia tangerina]